MVKAWVIVTSQGDIDPLPRWRGTTSKIQGRFDTRLSVVLCQCRCCYQKAYSDKTETAAQSLASLYDQKANHHQKSDCLNDGVGEKLYANAEDFAEVYPLFRTSLIPCFASVLTSIRTHGASGKHLSEGWNSMLALFKESAMQLMDDEMGGNVPFYRFFGMHWELRPQPQQRDHPRLWQQLY